MYVPLLLNRFQKSILLIIQYKSLKSCSWDSILQNLILRTRSCGTGFITQSSWVFHFHQTIMVGWKCFLYHSCTSSEGASRRGQPLNIFTWFTGAGRWPMKIRHPIGLCHSAPCTMVLVSFRKRAITYRALLRKMTDTDEASYGSSPLYIIYTRMPSVAVVSTKDEDACRTLLQKMTLKMVSCGSSPPCTRNCSKCAVCCVKFACFVNSHWIRTYGIDVYIYIYVRINIYIYVYVCFTLNVCYIYM